MKKSLLLLSATLLTGVVLMSSCKKDEETPAPTTPAATPTLYDRVGGTGLTADPNNPGTMIQKGRLTLRSVVDSAIFVIAGDQDMAKFFPVLLAEVGAGNTAGFAALSKNFTDFLCLATKQPGATYGGKSMKAAHDPATNNRMGEKAANADFDAFMGDIVEALRQNGVTANTPASDKKLFGDLAALLETTRGDIVQK